jgi:magnesium transporter
LPLIDKIFGGFYMISYWKYSKRFIQVNDFEKDCFVIATKPTSGEINLLVDDFKIPEDVINDMLDDDELSRLEVDEDKIFLIVRIPVHNPDNGIPFITIPLGFIIMSDCIVVLCQRKNELMDYLTDNKNGAFEKVNKWDFLLNLFLRNSKNYTNYLKKINAQISIIEKDLEKSTKNKELHKLLKMEKCLVYFNTSLHSNQLLWSKLNKSRYIKKDSYTEDLMEDVIIENRQAIEMAKIYSDIQSGLMDAFASIISNNLNIVMKQLTVVTIILMIPTLVSSFFGMNIHNGLEGNSFAFIGILAVSICISLIAVLLIRSKKWI